MTFHFVYIGTFVHFFKEDEAMRNAVESILKTKQERETARETAREMQKKKMAERLRDTITANGFSFAQFARACDIPHETFKKYISGEHLISVTALMPMAKELKVSVEYLLCADDEETANEAIPICERIREATNLSSDAIASLISLKNESEYVESINTILEEKTILDRLVKYFIFTKNKNVDEWNAKNINEYSIYKDILASTQRELETLPRTETINSENIYLYQLLEGFEAIVKKKYENPNKDLENAYKYQLMKEIETAVDRKLKNKNKKGAR